MSDNIVCQIFNFLVSRLLFYLFLSSFLFLDFTLLRGFFYFVFKLRYIFNLTILCSKWLSSFPRIFVNKGVKFCSFLWHRFVLFCSVLFCYVLTMKNIKTSWFLRIFNNMKFDWGEISQNWIFLSKTLASKFWQICIIV